jgi:hypothetical protein
MSDTSPANPNAPADGSDDSMRGLQAVQVALDRRDNGGDADVARGQGAACAAGTRRRPAAVSDGRRSRPAR